MTSKLLGILFLFATIDSRCQTGSYYSQNKGGGYRIALKQDGTYMQNMRNCKWGFKSEGKWLSKNDTVYLQADKFYNRDGKQVPVDKESAYRESYGYMNTFLLRNDTLIMVINNTLKYRLPKQIEKKEGN